MVQLVYKSCVTDACVWGLALWCKRHQTDVSFSIKLSYLLYKNNNNNILQLSKQLNFFYSFIGRPSSFYGWRWLVTFSLSLESRPIQVLILSFQLYWTLSTMLDTIRPPSALFTPAHQYFSVILTFVGKRTGFLNWITTSDRRTTAKYVNLYEHACRLQHLIAMSLIVMAWCDERTRRLCVLRTESIFTSLLLQAAHDLSSVSHWLVLMT